MINIYEDRFSWQSLTIRRPIGGVKMPSFGPEYPNFTKKKVSTHGTG